jgi:MOSC domain-containing protein YiiM
MSIATKVSWPQATRLAEVRTGTAARLGATEVMSAIGKMPRTGKVAIGPVGLQGDVQVTPVIHGGPEKAVLHYGAHHYADWARELPERAHLMQPGGFGENLVSHGLDESNVCIGDSIRVGGAVLQVAQPRQPCFKLSHRFREASMTQRAQETGRTGWFYRVLEPGEVEAGDTIEIIDRPQPEWTVRRVQHYLYVEPMDVAAARTLAGMAQLAEETRDVFRQRLDSGVLESWTLRMAPRGPI